jgi:hypothetical protein
MIRNSLLKLLVLEEIKAIEKVQKKKKKSLLMTVDCNISAASPSPHPVFSRVLEY